MILNGGGAKEVCVRFLILFRFGANKKSFSLWFW